MVGSGHGDRRTKRDAGSSNGEIGTRTLAMGEVPGSSIPHVDSPVGNFEIASGQLGAQIRRETAKGSTPIMDIRESGNRCAETGNTAQGNSDMLLLHGSRIQVGARDSTGSDASIQPGSVGPDPCDGDARGGGEGAVRGIDCEHEGRRIHDVRVAISGRPGHGIMESGPDSYADSIGHAVAPVAEEVGSQARSSTPAPGTPGGSANGLRDDRSYQAVVCGNVRIGSIDSNAVPDECRRGYVDDHPLNEMGCRAGTAGLQQEDGQAPSLHGDGVFQRGGVRTATDDCRSEFGDGEGVFGEFRGNCLIVTTENGWVNGEAWVEWATMFCEWMHEHRVRLGKPHQEAVLFVDGAPTRGNVRALEIFRSNGIRLITFRPHLTHILQPVDVSWVRAFKTEFVKLFRLWDHPELQEYLIQRLKPTRALSAVMLKRGQIVAAACEAAVSATRASLCMRAFTATGLSDCVGAFRPDRPLASRYVRESDEDPEGDPRRMQTKRIALGSRLLTSDNCIQELRERAAERRRWRPKRARARLDDEAAAADEDEENFLAEDGPAFDGLATATEMIFPPELGEDEE